MKSLKKLFQLSPQELWLLLQAAVLLSTVRLTLNFISVARLQQLGAETRTRAGRGALPPQVVARVVRVAAQRGIYRAKCLEQSLVLRWLLQRQGIDAQILFGARKEDEQIHGHAWVEVDGVALNEDSAVHKHFSPFQEITTSQIN